MHQKTKGKGLNDEMIKRCNTCKERWMGKGEKKEWQKIAETSHELIHPDVNLRDFHTLVPSSAEGECDCAHWGGG